MKFFLLLKEKSDDLSSKLNLWAQQLIPLVVVYYYYL
jgi:hypothetical protein